MSKPIIIAFMTLFFIISCTPEFKKPDLSGSIITNTEPDDIEPDPDTDDPTDNPTYGRHQHCLSIHQAHPRYGNGYYRIDHDLNLNTDYVTVYCDMSGGGYTEILGTARNTDFDEIQKFCNIKKIKRSLYRDNSKGLGWGYGKEANKRGGKACMKCKLFPFMDIKMELSAKAKVEGIHNLSKGYFWIPNKRYSRGWKVVNFYDHYKKDRKGGNQLFINTVKEINRLPIIDIENRAVDAPFDSNGDLRVCMGGHRKFYYNKRFIKHLRVR